MDRDKTVFSLADDNLFSSWLSGRFEYGPSSDGKSILLAIEQPFYSLDTHRAAGFVYDYDERIQPLYDRGEVVDRFNQTRSYQRAYWGTSSGLHDGGAQRWSFGFARDITTFANIDDPIVQQRLPEDRTFQYPFVRFESVQDDFETTHNLDQIGRTEDLYVGTRLLAEIGVLTSAFGSDRDGVIFTGEFDHSLMEGDDQRLLAEIGVSGRWENGSLANTAVNGRLRYYRRQSPHWLFFAELSGTAGTDLDLDNQLLLGGDTGLRGYPLRYQGGTQLAQLTLEQRLFTDWYPFRLFRVGAAAFVDVGRTWGENPVGQPNLGLLKDVGVGLRLGNSRSSRGSVVHIDLAMPLDGEDQLDGLQLTVQAKAGF